MNIRSNNYLMGVHVTSTLTELCTLSQWEWKLTTQADQIYLFFSLRLRKTLVSLSRQQICGRQTRIVYVMHTSWVRPNLHKFRHPAVGELWMTNVLFFPFVCFMLLLSALIESLLAVLCRPVLSDIHVLDTDIQNSTSSPKNLKGCSIAHWRRHYSEAWRIDSLRGRLCLRTLCLWPFAIVVSHFFQRCILQRLHNSQKKVHDTASYTDTCECLSIDFHIDDLINMWEKWEF